MNAQQSLQKISCGRCQSKKVRCNRVAPRCDKCEAVGAECIYSPRKPRSRKPGNDTSDRRLLVEILDRLSRLEDHCFPGNDSETDNDGDDTMSISSAGSGTAWATPVDEDPTRVVPPAIRDAIRSIKDESSRSILLSGVFCHLKQMQSCFFDNDGCIQAITSAITEIDLLEIKKPADHLKEPIIPKDLAKKLIENYYIVHQFEGFKYPLEKSFLAAMPDLTENPHVQLDYTSQVIYYSILLRGLLMDPDPHPNRSTMIQNVYQKCALLSDEWMKGIKNTEVDLLAASSMISTALEGCDIELSWRAFGHACSISRALGYFSVDETPSEKHNSASSEASSPQQEDEVEKNRKRFGFWHILRTDCLFRMSFGKPTLIPAGSWRVNFPDPTITGMDDESSRYIQIHFLSSMRLALTSMRYFDWVKGSSNPDPVSHDAIVDRYINEVQSILSDWDTESLLRMATNHVDSWLCMDVLFSSYKLLTILYQSKKSSSGHVLPYQAVDLARKSVKITKSLLGSSSPAFWGISLISLHQIVPFFTLFLDILGNPDHENLEEDLIAVNWVCDYVEMVVDDRAELKPVVILLKSMTDACQQAKMDRLAPQVASFK